MLELKGLKKAFDGISVLNGVDVSFKRGTKIGLSGGNGAGKSTAIGIISSLVKKTDGQVKIFGIDIDDNFEKAKSVDTKLHTQKVQMSILSLTFDTQEYSSELTFAASSDVQL